MNLTIYFIMIFCTFPIPSLDTTDGRYAFFTEEESMAEIIAYQFEDRDFDSNVTEVEYLVPKYLDSVERLHQCSDLEEIPTRLSNIEVYWGRLHKLVDQCCELEGDLDYTNDLKNALQNEMEILEKTYFGIKDLMDKENPEKIDRLLLMGDMIVSRMDQVLAMMGFPKKHADRQLMKDLLSMHLNWYTKAMKAS